MKIRKHTNGTVPLTELTHVLEASMKGCCGDAPSRGLLCDYHRGFRDAIEALEVLDDGAS